MTPTRRPLSRRIMHVVRRGHLCLGLFLLPWAILYGVTGFLFNHPTAFSDQPTTAFGPDAVSGTSLEKLPTPDELANQVVAALNARQSPATAYKLAGPAKYTRDFAFATVAADGQTVNVLFDVNAGGGTVRSTVPRTRVEPEKAPFAIGSGSPRKQAGERKPSMSRDGDGLKLDEPLHERLKTAIPTILDRTGFPTGEVTITSVPDLSFPIEADGRVWTATYNPMTGTVAGKPADSGTNENELSVRRFLTRLHLAHGYPGETNVRWFWAVVVDAMAFVMVFWGVSGLFMWWQIKATRRLGVVLLLLSAAAATALAMGMHGVLTR